MPLLPANMKVPRGWFWTASFSLALLLAGWAVSIVLRDPPALGRGQSSPPPAGREEPADTVVESRSQLEKASPPERIITDEIDPGLEKALESAGELTGAEARRNAAVTICLEWAQKDPAGAVTAALHFHLDQQPGALLANLTQQWAAVDLRGVQKWIETLPAGGQRDELVSRAAFVWSQTDPSDAAAWALDKIPQGSARRETVISIVHQWALQDMEGASAWVQRFPSGSLRDRAINELQGVAQYLTDK